MREQCWQAVAQVEGERERARVEELAEVRPQTVHRLVNEQDQKREGRIVSELKRDYLKRNRFGVEASLPSEELAFGGLFRHLIIS